MNHNTHGADGKGMTPEEMLSRLFDDDEDGHDGPKVIGVGKVSGKDLLSIFETLGVKVPGMESKAKKSPSDDESQQDEEKDTNPNDDPRKHFNSSITIRFDATGNTSKFSLGLDIHGSTQFAEIAMTEALAAFVEHNTPDVNTESLIQDLMLNIVLARAMTKAAQLDNPDKKTPGGGVLH